MKKVLLSLLVVAISVAGYGQVIFTPQSLGGSLTTKSTVLGALKAGRGTVITSFPDTLTANLDIRIKNEDGLQIKVHDTIFVRDTTAHKWLKFAAQSFFFDGDSLSLNPVTGELCIYKIGVPTCYILTTSTGGSRDSLALNYDSSWIYHYSNGILRSDSVYIYRTYLYGDYHFVFDPYLNGKILRATRLVDSIYASPFGTAYNYVKYANGHIDSIPRGGGGTVLDTAFTFIVRDSLSTPEVLPPDGSIFLVGTSPTGLFTGHANEIATFDSIPGTYSFQVAVVGNLLLNAATSYVSQLVGSTWVRLGQPVLHQGGDSPTYGTIDMGSKGAFGINFRTNNAIAAHLSPFDGQGSRFTVHNLIGSSVYLDASSVNVGSIGLGYSGGYSTINANGLMTTKSNANWTMQNNSSFGTIISACGACGPSDLLTLKGDLAYNHLFKARTTSLSGDISLGIGLNVTTPSDVIFNVETINQGSIPAPKMTDAQMRALAGLITAGTVTTPGSGYTPGTYPTYVITGGTGAGSPGFTTGPLVIGGGGTITTGIAGGYGYHIGDVLTVTAGSVGGTGSGYTFTVTSVRALQGLMVFNLTDSSYYQFDGNVWQDLYNVSSSSQDLQQTMDIGATFNKDNTIDINGHKLSTLNGKVEINVNNTTPVVDFGIFQVNDSAGIPMLYANPALYEAGLLVWKDGHYATEIGATAGGFSIATASPDNLIQAGITGNNLFGNLALNASNRMTAFADTFAINSTIAGASNGYVWTLANHFTGTGYWGPVSSSTGTVNSGTANRLAYYGSTGTTLSELPAITANRALASDANGLPIAATTTATELGYVNGVTSAIQTQLNAKQAAISVAAPITLTGVTIGADTTTANTGLANLRRLNGKLDTSNALPALLTLPAVDQLLKWDGTKFINFTPNYSSINGTGFVKATGTTLSYDNSTYLTTALGASTYLPLVGATYTTTTGNGLALTTSTLTSGNLVSLISSGTAATGNFQTVLLDSIYGANSTSAMTTYGARIYNKHTGTTSTNVGLLIEASGGTTNNALQIVGTTIFPGHSFDGYNLTAYNDAPLNFNQQGTTNWGTSFTVGATASLSTVYTKTGNFGIGFLNASGAAGTAAKLHVLETTEQLRLGYDASNYMKFTVSSTGTTTMATAGTNAGIVLTPSGAGYITGSGNGFLGPLTTNNIGATGAGSILVAPNSAGFRVNGNSYFGASATPTALVDITAGTTAIAPLGLNSGPLLSSPLAGKIEFLTDAYYGTITTGAARKTFAFLENPIFSGVTFADATNIVFNTTTGTKIGTATSQKLSFYNSTPIVQPSGSVITALTNLGLVATPTVSESELTITDITTNNASISAHGFTPKYPNDATKFLDGTGAYTVPTGTGGITLSAIGASANANGATLTGTVLNLEPASASFGGIVTTGAQTFAGTKTYTTVVANNLQTAATSTNANFQSIGQSSGQGLSSSISTASYLTGGNNIQLRAGMRGSTSTVATAGNDVFAFGIGDNAYTEATSGTSALAGGLYIKTQTFTNGSGATTDFQNAYFGDQPTGGTNNWSINAGASKFRGLLTVSGGILGSATNDAATAGNVGEEFNSAISTYTNFATTATYQNITSITLSAGDWDLSAFFTYSSNSSTITAASNAIFVVSTTTASAAGATEGININYVPQAALLGTSKFSDAITPYRVSISGSTTYYLNAQATFTLGNPQYVGSIRARRVR